MFKYIFQVYINILEQFMCMLRANEDFGNLVYIFLYILILYNLYVICSFLFTIVIHLLVHFNVKILQTINKCIWHANNWDFAVFMWMIQHWITPPTHFNIWNWRFLLKLIILICRSNKAFEYYEQGLYVKMKNFYWFGRSNRTAMAYRTHAFAKYWTR